MMNEIVYMILGFLFFIMGLVLMCSDNEGCYYLDNKAYKEKCKKLCKKYNKCSHFNVDLSYEKCKHCKFNNGGVLHE